MNPFVELASKSIKTYLETGHKIKPPSDLPSKMLDERKGVFVCLKKKGGLRGCIGTYLPTKDNLAQEIIDNAISAAISDPRFHPVNSEELEDLEISVDILSNPELVESLTQLNPKEYGILVKTKDGRSGLLLPDLEGVDTSQQQIAIACQKGGINLQIDKISLFRFKVERHQ